MMLVAAKVRDFMTKDLVTFNAEVEILHAVNIMIENDIAAAPVVDDEGTLVGIITERDCLNVVLNAGYHSEYGGQVSEFMSKDVNTIEANESIIDAAKLFFGDKFHRYPVLENGRLVGQISRRDVLRALVNLW